MVGAPSGIVLSATLCASGIGSRRTRPDSKRAPAGNPPSFRTIATLSDSWTWMERGCLSLRIESKSTPCSGEHANLQEPPIRALKVEIQERNYDGKNPVRL